MKYLVSLREVNQHFSQYIHSVEKGNEVIITRRGKPIAMMSSFEQQKKLTPQQEKSLQHLLSMMNKGFSFEGESFKRDELHER